METYRDETIFRIQTELKYEKLKNEELNRELEELREKSKNSDGIQTQLNQLLQENARLKKLAGEK